MTAPSATARVQTMTMPRLNHDELSKQIDRVHVDVKGAQIFTRSQVRLMNAESESKQLEAAGREMRSEIEWTKIQITRLQSVLKDQETNEADNALDLRAVLKQIAQLRDDGVTVPEAPKADTQADTQE